MAKDPKQKFVFLEGPPTANGLPHPGHVLTRTMKDSVCRYQAMQGNVDVLAGVSDPPIVKLQLSLDASYVPPYFEQYTFDGYIECSTV